MRQILEKIIAEGFDNQKWTSFFREKNENCWRPKSADLSGYNTADFTNGEKLGEYDFDAGKKVIIAAFFSKKSLSERSGKLAQYKIGKDVLTDKGFDAGIFIFRDENNNFRFSYIETNYLGTRRDFSHFRRFTYFVSKEFTNKTFLQMIGDEDFGTAAKIKDAFSVEKVTKEFYLEYHKRFEALSAELNKNRIFSFVAEENRIKYDDFAKKLLGQIVFLYFIQKKGWLGVPKDEKWGNGDRNFMSKLYKRAEKEECNFYNDFLEPLFYNTLNNSRRNSADPSFSKLFNSRVPFLNGGLFEPEYDWEETSICLDNSIFKDILETFDRFNFTIEEESPDDKEVAIDPEMLGKVFENLLNENLRKGKGTYYTPREIVYYMCKESLINYLIEKTAMDEKKIRKLVTGAEIVRDSALVGIENESQEKMLEAAEKNLFLNKKEGEKIDNALKEIKIVDPACGSGAFLVGMLNEIVRCRLYLSDWILRLNKKEYELKKETIQNCIYGVDIDPGAVDIAKLRLWLSLVVEHNFDEIEPLPNLDYRIMCGNSLLEEFEGVKFYGDMDDKMQKTDALFTDSFATDYREKSRKLQNKIKEYFTLNDNADKRKRQKEINDLKDWLIRAPLERQKNAISKRNEEEKAKTDMMNKKSREKYLAQFGKDFSSEINIKTALDNLHNPKEAKPFFLWKLEFIDVFEEKGGFDVVIANPPYIRISGISENEDRLIRSIYKTVFGHYDVYIPFMDKGIGLLNHSGTLSYITPNKYLIKRYANKLRPFILANCHLLKLIDTSQARTFDTASVYPVITILTNRITQGKVYIAILDDNSFEQFFHGLYSGGYFLNQDDFGNNKNHIFDISIQPGSLSLFRKILIDTKPLGDYARILTGTPAIEKFYRWKTLLFPEGKLPRGKKALKFINVSNIDRYKIEWGKKIRSSGLKIEKPYIVFDDDLIGKNKWSVFDKRKIVIKGTAKQLTAAFDDIGYANVSLYAIIFSLDHDDKTKNYYHLALINSKLINFWYCKKFASANLAGNYISFNGVYLVQIPIKKLKSNNQKIFAKIVDKILAITKSSDYLGNPAKKEEVKKYETQIDRLVYKLYGLTTSEIKIIEDSVR